MAWSTENIYLGGSNTTAEWLRSNGIRFFDLRPPAVPARIIAARTVSIPASHEPQFTPWRQTAQIIEPDRLADWIIADYATQQSFPDRSQLFELKWISEYLKIPVVIYGAETFGGVFEYEWCWQFGAVERALIRGERNTARHGIRSTQPIGRVLEILEFASVADTSPAILPHTSIVSQMLTAFGIQSSGIFNPHKREFAWEDHIG